VAGGLAAVRPRGQVIYIDSGGRGRCVIAAGALCSNGAAARRSAANAGSVTLIAELRG